MNRMIYNLINRLRFILLLICVFFQIYGVIFRIDFALIFGSLLYLLSLLVGIIQIALISKQHKNKKKLNPNRKTTIDKLARIIEGFVLISGIVMIIFSGTYKEFATPGMIIWIGSVLIYFLSGIIIESLTKIPLEFGYGGWKIKRFRTRKRR